MLPAGFWVVHLRVLCALVHVFNYDHATAKNIDQFRIMLYIFKVCAPTFHRDAGLPIHDLQISDNFPRDSPGFFEDAHPSVGPIDVHFVNHTHWCWTADDLRTLDLLPSSPGSGSMVRWWVLGTGAPSLSFVFCFFSGALFCCFRVTHT